MFIQLSKPKRALLISIIVFSINSLLSHGSTLSMHQAVKLALQRDTKTQSLTHTIKAKKAQAQAVSELPDPALKLGVKNLPTDSFSFDQEAMTQFSLSISQQFPAGNSLQLQKEMQLLSADERQHHLQLRHLQIILYTRQAWLETYYLLHAGKILKSNRQLFEQLLTITRSLYSLGKRLQQDVLRAELEVSHLNERILTMENQYSEAQIQLARWCGNIVYQSSLENEFLTLREVPLTVKESSTLAQLLRTHPVLLKLQSQIAASEKAVRLAQQTYKPRWGVDLGYGYRDGVNFNGDSRADFFSVMVNVKMPLFNHQKQDKTVSSKRYEHAAIQAHYVDKLRDTTKELQTVYQRWQQFKQRRQLFEQHLLKQSEEQSLAAFNAYQSDATDFADLMRAYLHNHHTHLDYQRLLVDEQKMLASIHFFVEQTPAIDPSIKGEK